MNCAGGIVNLPVGESITEVSRSENELPTRIESQRYDTCSSHRTTYRLVTLFNQIRRNGVPSQRSTPGNQERLAVGRVEDFSE